MAGTEGVDDLAAGDGGADDGREGRDDGGVFLAGGGEHREGASLSERECTALGALLEQEDWPHDYFPFAELTYDDGKVQQTNFHQYPSLRLNQTPVIVTKS